MHLRFARTLSQLRHEKGVSQRQAAQELGVSQALLSHYENGIREPGLAFVVKACDYYQVSADYLLGGAPPGPAQRRRTPGPKRMREPCCKRPMPSARSAWTCAAGSPPWASCFAGWLAR